MNVEFDGMMVNALPIAIGVLVVVLVILWFKKHRLSYLLCAAIFGIYLLFAIAQTFFPIAVSGNYVDSMRQIPFTSFINLNPFYFGGFGATFQDSSFTFFLNILLTVPFGFGINFLVGIRPKNILWLAIGVGLVTELTQLVISLLLRYPYRFIDINDVIMNALGILIGYSIFRILAWLYVWVINHIQIRLRGLPAYIYEIASRESAMER